MFQSLSDFAPSEVNGVAGLAGQPGHIGAGHPLEGRQFKGLKGARVEFPADYVEEDHEKGFFKGGIPRLVGSVFTGLHFEQSLGGFFSAERSETLSGTAAVFGYLVSNQGRQPIAETTPGRIVVEHILRLENGQHHLLNDFLGRVVGAAPPPGGAVEGSPIAIEKLVPGEVITPPAEAFEQNGLGVVAVGVHTVSLR